DAPAEIRGEFRPIATSVPGVSVSEHLPRLAAMMHRLIPIRTIVGGVDDHACHMCLTGWSRAGNPPAGGRPSFRSVVATLHRSRDRSIPPYISLAERMLHPPYNDPGPGFLGIASAPFAPGGPIRAAMTLEGISAERFRDREALLGRFDSLRREIDNGGL